MPDVTVCERPKGLPIATTKSPTLDLRGVAQADLDEIVGLHLEHGDVRRGVGADDLSLEIVAVLQRHGDLARVLDDVRVRDDVAVLRVEDHPGAGALEFARAELG